VIKRLVLSIGSVLLTLQLVGCAHRGLYKIQDGSLVAVPDSLLSETELNTVRQEITRDLSRTGFNHGIPFLWFMCVQPTSPYRKHYVYAIPVISFHLPGVTVGNFANLRITHAPLSSNVVSDWPWSWDTNLLFLWQNHHSYYGVLNDSEIVLYRDYVGSLFFIPISRLFVGPREVIRIRRAAAP